MPSARDGGSLGRRARLFAERTATTFSPRLAAHVKLWRHASRSARGGASRWTGSVGVDFDEGAHRRRIDRWREHATLFRSLRETRLPATGEPLLENAWYASPDAEIYAAMLAELRPSNVVEVGGGYSTLIARRAAELLDLPLHLTVVDPSPRAEVRDAADELIAAPIQDVDPSSLGLGPGAVLFVDSTHVSLPGGDVPYLYNVLIPGLPPGTVVHAHDVYLPFDYPLGVPLYSEQYVLHALLAGSPRYRVLFATYLMWRTMPEKLADATGSRSAGASFWFQVEHPSA